MYKFSMESKKSSGVSPEDQARLDAMGTERVLADLSAKYQPVNPDEVAPLSDLSKEDQARLDATRGLTVLEQLREKRNALMRELESLPRHRETYQKQELEVVVRVNKQLQGFVDNFNLGVTKQTLSLGSPEYQSLCKQYIEQVMRYLDQEHFWAHKFTTENTGGASSSQPLESSADDSVYYTTRSGISLRLKRSVSDRGLGVVIQPFYEKIIFELPDSRLKLEEPKIGTRVTEYRSDEFRDLLKRGEVSNDFVSTNEIFLKDGKIFLVSSNDQKPHEGDRVNNILETRA